MVCEELRKNGGHHHILITQFIVLDLLIFSYVITTFWAEFMAAKIFRDVITYDWAATQAQYSLHSIFAIATLRSVAFG